ncbi:MAG: hypothetical protein Ct9H300mP7_3650 [Verrucomicrobiota bacterium]|nr:MAG: hypothetical protein Ct9H300mP7_3650 [Verrucomicrobiota bacterium]
MRNLERTPAVRLFRSSPAKSIVRHFATKGQTIDAPYTGKPCIYFYYQKERKEEYTDSDGDRQTRWVTVEEYDRQVSKFLLADSSGKATVEPTTLTSVSHQKHIIGATTAIPRPGLSRVRRPSFLAMPDRPPTATWLASPRRGIIRRSCRPTARQLNVRHGLGRIWMFSLALVALSFGIMFTCWMVGVQKLLCS